MKIGHLWVQKKKLWFIKRVEIWWKIAAAANAVVTVAEFVSPDCGVSAIDIEQTPKIDDIFFSILNYAIWICLFFINKAFVKLAQMEKKKDQYLRHSVTA